MMSKLGLLAGPVTHVIWGSTNLAKAFLVSLKLPGLISLLAKILLFSYFYFFFFPN
jgi:hypothetical protein